MNPVASIIIALGSGLFVLAGLGLLRFRTPYARFHAAGKASPIAFLLVAVGAGIELGPGPSARLAVAAAALVLTLPVGVHLLFRAVHSTDPGFLLPVDELAMATGRTERVQRKPPPAPGETVAQVRPPSAPGETVAQAEGGREWERPEGVRQEG